MLRIFKPVKIQRLRPGLKPQTWVPEASMLTTRPPKLSHVGNMLSISFVKKGNKMLIRNTKNLLSKWNIVG